jgi:hypothetical protein
MEKAACFACRPDFGGVQASSTFNPTNSCHRKATAPSQAFFTASTIPTTCLFNTATRTSPPRILFPSFPGTTQDRKRNPPTCLANAIFTMPAPSAAQQKAYVLEVVQVTQADSKTAAKLLAKSNWNTSVAINAYVDVLSSWMTWFERVGFEPSGA